MRTGRRRLVLVLCPGLVVGSLTLANLDGANLTVARAETPSWNLTGDHPWILASSADHKWHVALRESDDRPFLLVDATADEGQAQRWAQSHIADAVEELAAE